MRLPAGLWLGVLPSANDGKQRQCRRGHSGYYRGRLGQEESPEASGNATFIASYNRQDA